MMLRVMVTSNGSLPPRAMVMVTLVPGLPRSTRTTLSRFMPCALSPSIATIRSPG